MPWLEIRRTAGGTVLHPRGTPVEFSTARAKAGLAWIVLFLVFVPFGVLVVASLVNLVTGHPAPALPWASVVEAGLLIYLGATVPGRGVLGVVARYVVRRRLRVGIAIVVVAAIAVWALSQEAATARAEAPAKHALLRAVAVVLRANPSQQFTATSRVLAALRAGGVNAVAGAPHAGQVGVDVTDHGGQVVFVYDRPATASCIAIVVTAPSALDPAADSPTNMPVAYGEWADLRCDPTSLPSTSAYAGAGAPSWTASQHDWLSGS